MLPAAVAAWPVSTSAATAPAVLARVQSSASVPYSGYAESSGGLALPVTTTQFSSLADLFGDRTRLRVWWRSGTDWRIDTVNASGESDTHRSAAQTWTWDYEANAATFGDPAQKVAVRLPVAGDLLPADLARRLLSEATPAEVSRISDRRVAGRTALGLRLTPNSPDSTVGRVNVWADAVTGIPLRVEVYGSPEQPAVLTSQYLDLSTAPPSASDVTFTPPAGAKLRTSMDAPDVAALIDRFGRAVLPEKLAGVDRNPDLPNVGAVGVFGHGATEFAAVPLPGRISASLRDQLEKTPGVTTSGDQLSTSIGPLTLVVVPAAHGGDWLLTGTVTADLLVRAAKDLPADTGLDR